MKYSTALKLGLVAAVLLALPSCSNKREDLKSPCVGTDDSPCGPHRSINGWWLKGHNAA